eukprot:4777863-Prymnesium_polylepis.1
MGTWGDGLHAIQNQGLQLGVITGENFKQAIDAGRVEYRCSSGPTRTPRRLAASARAAGAEGGR